MMFSTEKPARPPGKNSRYSKAVAETILERLVEGESLRAICRTQGMPDERTVRRWVDSNIEGFAPQYARARACARYAMMDEIQDILTEGFDPVRLARTGGSAAVYAALAARRVLVDGIRWKMARMAPKRKQR